MHVFFFLPDQLMWYFGAGTVNWLVDFMNLNDWNVSICNFPVSLFAAATAGSVLF